MIFSDAINQAWQDHVDSIRSFIQVNQLYKKLAEEVSYTLEREVRCAGIEFASISHRTKSLDSFCEKIIRKAYKEPIKEITDIAGVRIVYLYTDDRTKIEDIIRKCFQVVERVDKLTPNETERFGYGAIHYLVTLGVSSSGARYDEIKAFVCEIQVKTILQDAWAIVAHHLSYKQESDVPPKLRRKLNALSGLFETADDQFDQLRKERILLSEELKKQVTEQPPKFLDHQINLDNLLEYMLWRFPDRKITERPSASILLDELNKYGYTHLNKLEKAIASAYDAVTAYEKAYPPKDTETKMDTIYAPMGFIRKALEFVNEEVRKNRLGSGGAAYNQTMELMHLLK